jgi:predicted porin
LEKFEMKKSLIALAVLAASGAAMAQSSVTLYGIADVWVGSIDDGKTTTTKMISGGVSTSRWGMKGSEDLGGGLKANFGLEQKIILDDGTTGTGFDRQAWVGFSGGFGEVRLGKTGTPFDDYTGGAYGAFDSDLAPHNLGSMPSPGYTGKPNNGIKYTTPVMGGFAAGLTYSLNEKVAGALEVTGLGVNYAAGPVVAFLAYQKETKYQNPVDVTYLKGGAAYNFGMATAKAYYATTSDLGNVAGADVNEWELSVDYPLSSAVTLSATYANADYNAAAGNKETSGYALAAAYSLSKRTTVYGGFGSVTTDFVGATPDADTTAFAIGVKHSF